MRSISFFLLFSAITIASGAKANQDSGLGLNLTGISYWSSQWMLLDVMKQASNGSGKLWATSNAVTYQYDTGHQHRLNLDQQGWPTALPAEDDADFHYVTTIIYQDNEHYPVGNYVILYEGEGTLEYTGPTLIESSPGRDLVQLDENQVFHLKILRTDPNNSGDYIRNVRIIVPGGSCSQKADDFARDPSACDAPESFIPFEQSYQTRVFHPLFIQDVKPFRTLRFMQFFSTISNPLRYWHQRPKFEYASWGLENGSPLELAIILANKTNAEPWLNVPVRVDNEFISSMASLLKAHLKEDLSFYFEFGNEIWNNAWPYNVDGNYLSQQGQTLWHTSNAQPLDYRLNYYGMRSAQGCRIFKQEFAAESHRVRCVMGVQTGVPWVAEQSLLCPLYAQQNGGQHCAQEMDVLAVGNYFGGYFADDRYLEILSAWSTQGPAGVDQVFAELTQGELYDLTYNPEEPEWWQAPEHGALSQSRQQIAGNLALAQRHGLMLAAYESGQHLTFAGYMADGRAAISRNLFEEANRDSRMADIYHRYLHDWIEAGGGLNILFESTGRWDRWGMFPLKEFQLQEQAYKWQAVNQFMASQPCWWQRCQRQLTEPDNGQADPDPGEGNPDPGEDPEVPEDYWITLAASPVVDTMGIKLQWQSNLPADTEFVLYRDDIEIWRGSNSEHELFWQPLRQEFNYSVEAIINQQQRIVSGPVSSQAGDSFAPSSVEELTVGLEDTGVRLSWTASTDNHAVKFYKVYRNDAPLGLVTDTQFVDPWPPAGTVSYHVIAEDHFNNQSDRVSVTIEIAP